MVSSSHVVGETADERTVVSSRNDKPDDLGAQMRRNGHLPTYPVSKMTMPMRKTFLLPKMSASLPHVGTDI